jgi:iron complex outermembrane receptor protein
MRSALCPLALSLSLCTHAAWAQDEKPKPPADAQPPAAAPAPAAQQLDPVTVTGTREKGVVERKTAGTALFGAGDVRETPFSVNIVNSTEIKNRQATTFIGALRADPAVASEFGADDGYIFEAFSIRGFFVTNQIYDGHLIEAYYTSRTPETTERIEVLRGPAAFRYGFTAPGGVINIVTKQPTSTPLRSLTGSVTDYGRIGAHLDLGGRVGEDARFGYRLNAVASGGDAVFDDSTKDRRILALATDYRLSSATTLYLSLEHSDVEGRGGGMDGYRRVYADADGRLLDPIPDPRRQWLPSWGYGKAQEDVAGLRVAWQFAPDWVFDTSARYARKREEVWGGVNFGPTWSANGDHTLDYNGYIWEPQTTSLTSFVQGTLRAGATRHRVTAGVSRTDITIDFSLAANAFSNTVQSNYFNPAVLPEAAPDWLPAVNGGKRTQEGVFVSDQIDIGRWHPLLGLRWSRFDAETDAFNPRPSKSIEATPLLGVTYDWSESSMLYASYATGLEDGGRAPIGTDNAGAQMPALDTKSVEFGFKADVLRGAATFDAALFRIEKTAAFTNAANVFVQQGRQVHQGLEVLAKGRFARALEISAGAQLLDAQFEGNPATDGQRPANVPRLRAVFSGDYDLAAVPGLTLTGLVSHTGKREINVPNRGQTRADTLLDLGVRYETRSGASRVTGRLNVENVFDRRYWNTVSFNGAETGTPRTVKASVEVQF